MQGGHLLGLCIRRGGRRLEIDDDDVKRRSLSASIFIFHVVVIKSCSEDTQRHVRVAYFNNGQHRLDRFQTGNYTSLPLHLWVHDNTTSYPSTFLCVGLTNSQRNKLQQASFPGI